MDFSVDRNVFQEAVQRTLGIVERKTTIPILSNILIRADSTSIRIVATDREIGLVADYEARVSEKGDITVNARKLYEMIREMEGEQIHFTTSGNNQAFLAAEKAEYRIPGIPADDFPDVRREDNIPCFTIPAWLLKGIIKKVFYAASTDETRPSLNGIFFKKEGTICEMVATDGYRLSLVAQALPEEKDDGLSVEGVILPRKGLGEVRKMVDDGEGVVEMGVADHVMVVRKDTSMLRLGLIDAVYPDYRRVVPKDRGASVLIEKHRFLQSLRRMGVMSTELFNGVIISLDKGIMKLNSTNPDVGEANEEVPVDYNDGSISAGFNVRYLIEAVDSMEGETISFEMRSDGGPCVMRVKGTDDHLCIIMPINKIE